jgi:50S ribosomal subunit-associated GTPase HflX
MGFLDGKRVILVALLSPRADVAQEMGHLAEQVREAGGIVLGSVVQRRGVSRSLRPGGTLAARAAVPLHPATYIGQGKVRELQRLCTTILPDVIIFYNRLGETQRRTLERVTGTMIIDRFALEST